MGVFECEQPDRQGCGLFVLATAVAFSCHIQDAACEH